MSQPSDNYVLCPACQKENVLGAEKCAHCGADLPLPTQTITEDVAPVPPADTLQQTEAAALPSDAVRAGTVALYIAGSPDPIVIKDQREIVLGRRAPGSYLPTVDLTDHNAHLLGVSRHHAMIAVYDKGFTITDLASSNGTWVNGQRLSPGKPQPLHSGDQIRLGQLTLTFHSTPIQYIYFTEASSAVLAAGKMSPDYLSKRVLPYLQAIIQAQNIVDELLGRSAEAGIKSIHVLVPRSLAVHLDSAAEVVQFLKAMLIPWRTHYAEQLDRLAAASESGECAPTPALEQAQNQLITAWVSQLKPSLTDEAKQPYVARLADALCPLLFGSLIVLLEPPQTPPEPLERPSA